MLKKSNREKSVSMELHYNIYEDDTIKEKAYVDAERNVN